jgi:hypothetical protein
MTIKEPLLGQLNQGSIFCCAKAEQYPNCEVSGVVLTARCDLEQDKYNVLNYAPVVRLSDWLAVDGHDIIVSRVASDFDSRVESALKTIDLPKSIFNSQTLLSILETLIRAPDASQKLKKAEAKFVELEERRRSIARWQSGYSTSNADLYDHCDAFVRTAVKELIHHKMIGYYYLPNLEVGSDETGFVVLLREVNHLPRRLSRLIANGVNATDGELQRIADWRAYIEF